jgi:hypothetical protein
MSDELRIIIKSWAADGVTGINAIIAIKKITL